jgi:outer membrane immunogenic protein
MKKFLLSSAAFLGLTAAAAAADLPRRAAPPVFAPIPVFTWTGFYVGLNAGYGWGNNNNDGLGDAFSVVVPGGGTANVFPFAGFGLNDTSNNDGFVGGAQAGFNYQFTPGSGFVVGIEADIDWLGGNNDNKNTFGFGALGGGPFGNTFAVSGTSFAPGFGIAPTVGGGGNIVLFNNAFGNGLFNNSGSGRSDWFGTVRGRVGYAFDRLLIFATGGFAWTDNNNSNNGFFGFGSNNIPAGFFVSPAAAARGATVLPGTAFFGGSNSNNGWGWTIGGGAEYAFTNNLTVKLEGLYVNFDSNKNNGFFGANNVVGVSNTGAPIFGGGFGGSSNNNDFFLVRGGINFKFGS